MNDEEKEIHHGGSFQIGLFFGGLLGAVIIYLLGTKEGKKLSRDWKNTGDDWIEDIERKLHLLEQKGSEFLEEGKGIKEEIAEKFKDSKEQLTQKAAEEADETLGHIEKLQERGRDTTSSIRKRLFKNTRKK